MKHLNSALAGFALAALVPLAGCSKAADEADTEQTSVDRTLAAAISAAPNLSQVSRALSDTGLAGIFDGPGSYTVLAPDDEAYAKLGDEGRGELSSPEGKPVLVAVLRDHIVPGHLTPDTIRKAVEDQGGPVTMRTLGDGTVSFSIDGDTLRVESDDGMSARIDGPALSASNGVAIPIDGLLKTPQPQPAG